MECHVWAPAEQMYGYNSRWFELVQRFSVRGKRVHDARLVAVFQAHNIEHLISFNTADFAAFPFLSLLDPDPFAGMPQE